VHVILLDNGRSTILEADTRELLRCIRCGACLNACPVYRQVGGGHSYGAVYSGPIGAVITPLLKGLGNFADLPQASSLCGACHRACPVSIDIPRHLVHLRHRLVERRVKGWGQRAVYRAWAASLRSAALYRAAGRLARTVLRRRAADRTWIDTPKWPVTPWVDGRSFPVPAKQNFREWWRERSQAS
jgi:L-lactate dehydrogenase complex protein LldF